MWLGPPFMNSQITDLARAGKCGACGAIGLDPSCVSNASPCPHRMELSASMRMPPPASLRKSRRELAIWMLPQLLFMGLAPASESGSLESFDVDEFVGAHEGRAEVVQSLSAIAVVGLELPSNESFS